jgi:hypothetical protein
MSRSQEVGEKPINDVIVTDRAFHFLEPTKRGKARKLLHQRKALLLNASTPFIQLTKVVDLKEDNSNKKENKMDRSNIRTLNEYFEKNSEVFVRNTSKYMVSLTLYYSANGRVEPLAIPPMSVMCLTDYATKATLQESGDLRKLLQRKPSVLELISKEEYFAVIDAMTPEQHKEYEKKIQMAVNKTDPDTLVEKESEDQVGSQGPDSDTELPKSGIVNVDQNTPNAGDGNDFAVPGVTGVSPQVLGIIADATREKNPVSAEATINALNALELNKVDLSFIVSNTKRTIKKWAQLKLQELENKK